MEQATDSFVFDDIETMILTMLDYDKIKYSDRETLNQKGRKNGKQVLKEIRIDQGHCLHFDRMHPGSAFTVDLVNDDREYTRDKELLLCHPAEILGDESEICIMDTQNMRIGWNGFRRISKRPKNVVPIGNADILYERHSILFTGTRLPVYKKRILAFDKAGSEVLVKANGGFVGLKDGVGIHTASIIEDSRRSDAFLASISDSIEIKFPVPLDAYKELFIIRDGPLTTYGKKKAILHWVRKHTRNIETKQKSTPVKKHTRGITEFKIDTLNIKLSPN